VEVVIISNGSLVKQTHINIIDQSPIGNNVRANTATYSKILIP